ncbi:reverse transcriptase domain-containing protein [Tanacetum coccineum]|uniref:Reverse transcriptase domain-containing protein n=1 Tax=Tanacetum coccineum TaxID=301880 RepID=A0ABQ5ESA9_9ASTR
MQGTDISKRERHSTLMNEFDQFVAEAGKSLTFVYERFSTLVNNMDRNKVKPHEISINTKLLNSLQPEWAKYVTLTRQKYILKTEHYDELYDYLNQFQPHVNASKAKKATRDHDQLALVANSYVNPSYSHARMHKGQKRIKQLMKVMVWFRRLRKMKRMFRGFQELHQLRERQMFSAIIAMEKATMQEIVQNPEFNEFMLMNAYGDDQLEELNALEIMMAHIQPTNDKSDVEPTYDVEVIIVFDIIFDDPCVEDNSGQAKHDPNAHNQPYADIESITPCVAFDLLRDALSAIFGLSELKEMMTTINQGMSVEEIERVVAQRVAENASNRRKWEGNHNGISSQQNKGHKVLRAHTTWLINKKAYAGSLPLCNQCKFHHNGTCTVKCGNCKKVGHIIQNCKTPATTSNQQTRTCYECGSLRHYKSECPIVKFQKRVDMIHGGVRASKPKTMQDAIEFITKLMDKKDQHSWHGEKKHYDRSKPLCSKCNNHHDGPCAPKCHKCNRVGHLARDCRSSTNANTSNNQRGTGASQKATCYECGNQGHYMNDCPERKNQNH